MISPWRAAYRRFRSSPLRGQGSGWAIDLWGRWDGGWFARIAQHGYEQPHFTTAFFPLYPLLVRIVPWPLGGRYVLAGVIVSLVACVAGSRFSRGARA